MAVVFYFCARPTKRCSIIMKLVIGLFIFFGIVACNAKNKGIEENQNTNLDIKTILPGTWEAIGFSVHVNSFHGTDSTFIMNVEPGEWESKLQMRPIVTEYSADNRYRSLYRNLADSLVRTERGIWNVFGDTLMLISPEATYQYEVIQKGETLEFRSLLDWDGDGLEDDEYIGIQKIMKKH